MIRFHTWVLSAGMALMATMPSTGTAQAPDSAAAAGAQVQPQQASSSVGAGPARRKVRQSWTSSRTPLMEGDILTILIDEHTLATADLRDLRDSDRARDFDLLLGLPGGAIGGAFGLDNDVGSAGSKLSANEKIRSEPSPT